MVRRSFPGASFAMSTSPTSKPASPTSPEGGAETEREAENRRIREDDDRDEANEKAAKRRALAKQDLEVELEVPRRKSAISAASGILGGILLILKLGTVGVWAGFALVAWGLYHAARVAQTFAFPPGAIVFKGGQLELPRGPHRGKPVLVEASTVTAAYMLRRSVPWNTSSPVLVVELGDKAYVYPRDWFASEAEQRRVLNALVARRELPEST